MFKLGIVTISYNQGGFLPEAIESVLSIGVRNRLKYVVVDPGSTDRSRQLIQRYGTDLDVTIFEPDSGPAEGLNKGIRACEGCDILGYLNSDDRFAPGALDWVLDFFEQHSEIDVLLGSIGLIDASGNRSLRARVPDLFDLRRYAIKACNVFQQGTFFRQRIFNAAGGFNLANRTCWDGELVVDMALAGGRFGKTRRLLGDFRIHQDSITGSQRLRSQYEADRQRIAEKIYSSGVKRPPTVIERTVRIGYRLNPVRQAEYLWVRCAPHK